jgi:hypothetical protein
MARTTFCAENYEGTPRRFYAWVSVDLPAQIVIVKKTPANAGSRGFGYLLLLQFGFASKFGWSRCCVRQGDAIEMGD